MLALGATACQPTPTKPGTQRVVVLGDSVPNWALRDGPSGIDGTRFTLIDGTLAACDGAAGNPPARSRTGALVATSTSCGTGWPSMYPPHLTVRADVAVLQVGMHAMLDHLLGGTWRHPCHAPARSWYQSDIRARITYLEGKADEVVLVLPAWPGAMSGWIMPTDRAKRADCVRAAMRAAARATGTRVVDLGAYLCPTGAASCNTWRSNDGVHIDAARASTVVAWTLAQAAPPPAR